MRKGLALIIIGHINFIFGAIVHGSILRHISKPSQQISTEYTVTNIISVTSGLLVSQWFSFCVLKSTWHFKWACCEPSDIKPPGVSAFIETFYFKVFITQSYLQSHLYQQFCLFDAWEHQKLTRVIFFNFFFKLYLSDSVEYVSKQSRLNLLITGEPVLQNSYLSLRGRPHYNYSHVPHKLVGDKKILTLFSFIF